MSPPPLLRRDRALTAVAVLLDVAFHAGRGTAVAGGAEVAATLAVLKGLVLKGCTVTADALHCHPAMAEAVLAAKAHYALGLRGNHGPLHAAAEAGFAAAGDLLPCIGGTVLAGLLAAAVAVRLYRDERLALAV